MSKATAAITDRFKNTFIRAEGIDTTELQKALFMMGFRLGDDPESQRRVVHNPKGLMYLRVDENGTIWRSVAMDTPAIIGVVAEEVTEEAVIVAAEQVRQIKRKEGSEQKKRRALRKWDATATNHTLQTCPVRPANTTIVACKLRDGTVETNVASYFDWEVDGHMGDVMSYKVVGFKQKKQPTETRVPLETMVEGIADSMGRGVAIPFEPSAIAYPDRGYVAEAKPDTNPKRQYGVSSVPLNMWSQLASAYGALGLHNGGLKYGKANFTNTPVEASIYIAAAYRHLAAWAAGQEFDPADGVPNLGGVLANVAILLEARAAGTLIDDRLKMDGYVKEIDKLKEIAKNLNELHAGKNPRHYTLEME